MWADYGQDNDNDLINPPQKKTVWVNFYRGHISSWHDSAERAEQHATMNATAVAVPVEVEMP